MSRIFVIAALSVMPSMACGQVGSASEGDDVTPAPGEPAGGVDATEGAADPEKYERTVPPIANTAPVEGESADSRDKGELDVQAELLKLRREFDARISALEDRLDQQAARLEDLRKSAAATSEGNREPTTANKPSPASDGDEALATAGPTQKREARDAEITRLQGELEKLRADYAELFVAVSEHATAINNYAEGLAKHTESLKNQEEQLTETARDLTDVKAGQKEIDQRLRDVASNGQSAAGGSLNLLGNMQASEEFRDRFLENTRYRLRIRNTTGAEQPLSINGVFWTVRADEWTYVPVPLGPVTVLRPDFQPLEIAEDHIHWQTDSRGFYVDYDLARHEVAEPGKQ